jgi:uncharacterized integral membrane protein
MSFQTSGDAPERPLGEGPVTSPPSSETGTGADVTTGTDTQTPTRGEIPKTRTARAHNALIAGAIVLILLLVFILENTESVKISYFGAGFHMPLGVALLLAAIGGALLVGIVGTARIMQLRRSVRRRD